MASLAHCAASEAFFLGGKTGPVPISPLKATSPIRLDGARLVCG